MLIVAGSIEEHVDAPALSLGLGGLLCALDDADRHQEDVAMLDPVGRGRLHLPNGSPSLPCSLLAEPDEELALFLGEHELGRSRGFVLAALNGALVTSDLERRDMLLASSGNRDKDGQEWWTAKFPPPGQVVLAGELLVRTIKPFAFGPAAPLGVRSRTSALAERRAA